MDKLFRQSEIDLQRDQAAVRPAPGKAPRTRHLAHPAPIQRKRTAALQFANHEATRMAPPAELAILDELRAGSAGGVPVQMKEAPSGAATGTSPNAGGLPNAAGMKEKAASSEGAESPVFDGGFGLDHQIPDPVTPIFAAVKQWADTAFQSFDGDLSKLTPQDEQQPSNSKGETDKPPAGDESDPATKEAGNPDDKPALADTAPDTALDGTNDGSDEGGAPVQHKGAAARGGARQVAQAGIDGAGGPLPFLSTIQRAFGKHDVGGVRAHVGGQAQAANETMGSLAYAMGDHVAFRGSPDLHTAAHEAAHVVQQRAGVSLKGGVGEAGDRYEQHADRVADAVVRGDSAEALLDEYAGQGGGETGVQHKLCDTAPPAAPQFAGFSEYPAFYRAGSHTGGSHMNAGMDYLAFAGDYAKSAAEWASQMSQLNGAWEQLMTVHDAGCASIAQALAEALRTEVKIEGNALDIFGNLRSEVNKLGGAIDDLGRVAAKLAFADQLQSAATAMVSKLKAEIEEADTKQKKKELEEKYKALADKTNNLLGQIGGPLEKLIEGKPLDAVTQIMTGAANGAVKAAVDHYYASQTKAAVAPLKTKLSQLASQITLANDDLLNALPNIVDAPKEEAAMLDKKANDTIRDAEGNIVLHIHAMATVKGDENAAIRNLFGLIESHLAAVDPPAAAVLATANGVGIHGDGGKLDYIETVLAAKEREVSAFMSDGECEQGVEPDAEEQAAEQQYAAWLAQNRAIRTWCGSMKAWVSKNSQEVAFAQQFASGPHRAKAEDALNIVNSHMVSMAGGGKMPKMNWGAGQAGGKAR